MQEEYTWAICSRVIQSEIMTLPLETPRLLAEDTTFEELALERWLDDGGIQDAMSDCRDLAAVKVLHQFH
jgi:hypothetical protein